jgi:sulfate transport system substrate-binding protein
LFWRFAAFALGVAAVVWVGGLVRGAGAEPNTIKLLNVSYDPTRELWRELNAAFSDEYFRRTGKQVVVRQSHNASASQARAVVEGLPADVVTLALHPDTDQVRKAGLLADGWEDRLPNRSLAYYSCIVFVVRKGNPKGIKDWPDLVRPDAHINVITPNPKTSGNGRLSFLAAWAAVVANKGNREEAERYIDELYRRAPILDTGARGSTTTFVKKEIGDVHLTFENEAHLELREAGGNLEIVYPSVSIRCEPHLAWVDYTVNRRGTRDVAEAYLRFAYTPAAQEIIASNFYRPIDAEVLARHSSILPQVRLVTLEDVGLTWDKAQQEFFTQGALFDRLAARRSGRGP